MSTIEKLEDIQGLASASSDWLSSGDPSGVDKARNNLDELLDIVQDLIDEQMEKEISNEQK